MPFDNALSQGASLQQGEYLEPWDSSRVTRRQGPQDGDHAENYQNSRVDVKDGNGQVSDLPRNREIGAPFPKVEEDEKNQPVDNSENEDRHLLENQDASNKCAGGPPTWLSTAVLRQQNQELGNRENVGHVEAKWCPICSASGPQSCVCNSPMHAGDTNATSFLSQSTHTHWLSMHGTGMHASSSQHRQGEFDGRNDDFGINQQQIGLETELNLSAAHGRDAQPFLESLSHPPVTAPIYSGEYSRANWDGARQEAEREEIRKRCLITSHPLYADMLSHHAACLRVGTPVDQLPSIEAQLSRAPQVTEKYRVLRDQITDVSQDEQAELDRFMSEYTLMLGAFKEILQHHVYTDVAEAMMSCWDMEQALLRLTGVRADGGYGATMSDDDVEEYDSDYGSYEDYHDSGGYGPLMPTETERTLMERVRQELKHELKQGYKSKIEDVREEILRKRRAGKLPEGTTTVLKAWWKAHSKWPYPTEDEKELLIQETGLELKQVNNWFINQRKRNWHSNPLISSQSASKSKARKSW